MSPFKFRPLIILSAFLLCLAPPEISHAVERLTVQPGGVILHGSRSYSGAVMSAYQKAYAMNFEIWKPYDLPAGWYATFDGFPVAQVAENRWVYGQLGTEGVIRPTNILVGSVIPGHVPGLARIAAVWTWGKYINSPAFLKIQDYRCNRMGWLNDGVINTIIAWSTNRIGVWVWLGNRWRRFEPNSGEYTWQMLKRLSPWIADELRKNNAWYMSGGEPAEVADLARQWGMIWGGKVILESLRARGYDGGGNGDSGTTTSFRDNSGNSGGNTTPAPQENTNNGQGNWDVN